MLSSKPRWKGLLKFFGPLLFILFFIKVVDPKTTLNLLKEIKIGIVLLSLLLFPVVNAAQTFRWWIICRYVGITASYSGLFQVYYISWFLSALPLSGIMPLSKIIYLHEEGKPTGKVFVSITLDKLFDIIGLLFFGLFGFIYFPGILFGNQLLVGFLGGTLLIVGVGLVFGRKTWEGFRKLFKRFANKRLRLTGRNLEADMARFWSDFNLKIFLLLLGISIAIGILRSLVLYLLAISLDMDTSFGLIVACRALIGIINVIPVTISGLGTRDAILLLTLPLSGISKEAALALGLIAFLWTIGSKFSGVIFWLKRPLPAGSILAIKEKLFT